MLMGDGMVTKLWAYNVDISQFSSDYWGLHRGEVTGIAMQPGFKTRNMECWFAYMPKLVAADGVFIPEGCTTVHCLFMRSENLKRVSDDLRVPGTVGTVSSMFNNCKSLERVPEGLTIPYGATGCWWMFANCENLTELPSSFTVPDTVNKMHDMFRGCTSLTSLPEGVQIPHVEGVAVSVARMFQGCSSLKALPEGFSIPPLIASVFVAEGPAEKMDYMFSGCTSLTRFPDSFDFPADIAAGSTSPFYCTNMTDTYYGGNGSGVAAYGVHWADQHRTIVTTVPNGRFTASFILPDDQTGTYDEANPWMKVLTDSSGMLSEFSASPRAGAAFLGWYTSANLATRFDFSQPLKEDVELYAKYMQTAGPLPTVEFPDNGGPGGDPAIAGWSLSGDGALKITCAEGQTIADLRWSVVAAAANSLDPSCFEGWWGPLRDRVRRIEMQPRLRAQSAACWFGGMANLEDASAAFVPEGAGSADGFFFGCAKLAGLPAGFSLPEGVSTAASMFHGCSSLASLPAGFLLPESLENANQMFNYCSSLKGLPTGFTMSSRIADAYGMFANTGLEQLPGSFALNENLQKAASMFYGASSLRVLPQGFTLPKSVLQANFMFAFCSSLVSLPDGFTVPLDGSVQNIEGIFARCDSLTYLPASFDFPAQNVNGEAVETGILFRCSFADNPDYRLKTYYAGSSERVKALPWDGWQRTLTSYPDQLSSGAHAVSFVTKVAGQADYAPYLSVLTDASGKVPDPGSPSRFGYAFGGWRTEAGEPFDFAADSVAQDTVLFGTYTPVISIDAPTSVTLALGPDGKAASAAAYLRSRSAVPLRVSSVRCEQGSAADEVVDAASLASVRVGLSTAEGDEIALRLGGSGSNGAFALPAATPAAAAALDFSVGLTFPDSARFAFFGDGFTSEFAKLAFTVEPAA